jgi:hypothetical protein
VKQLDLSTVIDGSLRYYIDKLRFVKSQNVCLAIPKVGGQTLNFHPKMDAKTAALGYNESDNQKDNEFGKERMRPADLHLIRCLLNSL